MRSALLLSMFVLSLGTGCSNSPAPAPVVAPAPTPAPGDAPATSAAPAPAPDASPTWTPVPAADSKAAATATHLGAWYWIGTKTAARADVAGAPERYQLEFAEAGTVQVQADCNRGSGSYTLSAGALAFGPIAMTKMGCPDDSQDRDFMAQLASGGSLALDDGWLIVEISAGRGTMYFSRDPKSALER